jgi:hypothetical protein
MAKSNHNLRVVGGEEPRSIHDEFSHVLYDFCCSISLVKVLQRAVAQTADAELEAAIRIAIKALDAAHDRLDRATIRLSHEGAEDQGKLLARVVREASAARS